MELGAALLAAACGQGAAEPIADWQQRAATDPEVGPALPIADPTYVPIDGINPRLAADGKGTFLIAWELLDGGGIPLNRIAANGTISKGSTSLGSIGAETPDIAFDGTQFLVTWTEPGTPNRIVSQRVGTDGNTLSAPIHLADVGTNATRPTVACSAGECVVAWGDAAKLNAVRLDKGNQAAAPVAVRNAANPILRTGVSRNGAGFVLAWSEGTTSVASVFAQRFSANLTAQDVIPIQIAKDVPGQTYRVSAAASGAGDFVVSWLQGIPSNPSLHAARVAANGGLLDAPPLSVADTSKKPSNAGLAFNGTNYVVVWTETGGDPVHGAELGLDGTLGPTVVVAPALPTQAGPRLQLELVCDDKGCGTLWQESFAVLAKRLQLDATPIDAAPLVLDTKPAPRQLSAISAGDSSYLVLWRERRHWQSAQLTYANRLSPQGESLDGIGFQLAAPAASVAHSNGQWLTLQGNSGVGVSFQRILDDGTLLDPTALPVPLAAPASNFDPLGVVSDGTDFLVVWNTGASLQAVRVLADGSLPDKSPWLIASAKTKDWEAASDGSGYLFVWTDETADSGDVYSAHVSASGVAGPPSPVAVGLGQQTLPQVVVGPDGYWITWNQFGGAGGSLMAARAGHGGALIDKAGFMVASGVGQIAAFDGLRYLISWSTLAELGQGLEGIHATRFSPNGDRLDPSGFIVDENGRTRFASLGCGITLAAGPSPGEQPSVRSIREPEAVDGGCIAPDAGAAADSGTDSAIPDAAGTGTTPRAEDDSGCGCATPGARHVPRSVPFLLLLIGLAIRRCRGSPMGRRPATRTSRACFRSKTLGEDN